MTDSLESPYGVAIDAAGNLLVAAEGGVWKIGEDGGSAQTVYDASRASGVAVYAPPPTFTADTRQAVGTVGTGFTTRMPRAPRPESRTPLSRSPAAASHPD